MEAAAMGVKPKRAKTWLQSRPELRLQHAGELAERHGTGLIAQAAKHP